MLTKITKILSESLILYCKIHTHMQHRELAKKGNISNNGLCLISKYIWREGQVNFVLMRCCLEIVNYHNGEDSLTGAECRQVTLSPGKLELFGTECHYWEGHCIGCRWEHWSV